jgi:hypothetical protein
MAGEAIGVDGAGARGGRRRGDAGFSLAENLVAITLMGTAILTVIGAMWTTVRTSQFSDDQAKVEAVLGGAVDALASIAFQPCPVSDDGTNGYDQYAQVGAAAVDWPSSTVKITRMKYWDPYNDDWASTNGVEGSDCASTAFLSTAKTMQLLTITVTTPEGDYSRSIDLVMTDLRSKKVA